jgi:hypothetical protein
MESAFGGLAQLSGVEPAESADLDSPDFDSATAADAWLASPLQLRTRWQSDEWPLVIRSFQHDPAGDGVLALVGEELVQSELDVVDSSLVDPFFPVLFVTATPSGELCGSRLLPFPQMCRGGIHYPELLAGSPNQPDPFLYGVGEAALLTKARGQGDRLVCSIVVTTDGADGTSPLFDPGYRNWLEKVGGVTVAAAEGSAGPAADMLGNIAGRSGAAGGSLLLSSAMIPTVSILRQREGSGETTQSAVFLPLVIAGAECSQPVTLVDFPRDAPDTFEAAAKAFPAAWPRFVPASVTTLPETLGVAAIRLPTAGSLSDSELLIPATGPGLVVAPDKPSDLTWIVAPQDWRRDNLVQSLRALSIQLDAEAHHIAFLGDVDPEVLSAARELYPDRVSLSPDPASLSAKLKTKLAGYLGPDVILHDARTVASLSRFLDDSAVVSAACLLVSAEKRGKSWHVSAVDAGSIPGWREHGSGNPSALARLFLRSSFPVLRPPRDLWIARSSIVKKWLGNRPPARTSNGVHLCTALITASYLGRRGDQGAEIEVPPVPEHRSINAKTLFG